MTRTEAGRGGVLGRGRGLLPRGRRTRWLPLVAVLVLTAGVAALVTDASETAAANDFVVSRYADAYDGDESTVVAPASATTATVASGGATMHYDETSVGGELSQIAIDASVVGNGYRASYKSRVSLFFGTSVRVRGSVSFSGSCCGSAFITFVELGGVRTFTERACPDGSCPASNTFDVTVPRDSGEFDVSVVLQGGPDEVGGSIDIRLNAVLEFGTSPPSLEVGDAVELEGSTGSANLLSFPVTLSEPAPATGVSVSYATSDSTTQAGTDYEFTAGVLNFSAGESAKTVTVPINGDQDVEPDETLNLMLSGAVGATIDDGTGTGTIVNDDLALVDFDWTMPDRFGLDANGNGLIDYFTTAAAVSPSSWRVDLTYGVDGICDPALSPRFKVNGAVVLINDPALIFVDTSRCTAAYTFLTEDVYEVSLELFDGDGNSVGQATHDVTVQDWLIISLGDSVASGEGNPDIPGTPGWENRQCHRSASAGPAQAAIALERADPRTSVTFVHLACSGASISDGVLARYRGQEPGAWLPPQVDVMDAFVGTREIDAVTLSVGANDVRFSTVVTGCFVQTNCHLATTRNSMLQFFNGWLALLPGNYDALGLTLRQARYGVAPDRTYITEYFDAMRDHAGNFCDQAILEEGGAVPFLGISAAESQWASTDMMVHLNQQVAGGAGRNGWKYVGGIYDAFRTHGYCSNGRWIVQLTESLADQRNIDGTLHPNEAGHAFYAGRLAGALKADFYTVGDLNQPRSPR